MKYLLDTNACIEYLNTPASDVRRRLAHARPTDVCVCSIVQAELLYGARRSKQTDRSLAVVREFLAQFKNVPFDNGAAEVYGTIRAQLAVAGTMIGPYDLLIAATAIAHDLIVITHNKREFGRVAGLCIEDWQGQ
ncbi:MAG: type II toxin-antitoxin system VapC family toxin [bacterium]|nr:type II toxin-antitoxin system VapC family toxin [bacterium]